MDASGEMGQGRIFSKPFAGVESIGKFAGETGQGADEGSRNSACKGLYSKQALEGMARTPPSTGAAQIHVVLHNSKDKHDAEHKTCWWPPSGRVNPGACLGLASDPSVGPRVNRNRQMERELHKGKLFFFLGGRLPFRDLQ